MEKKTVELCEYKAPIVKAFEVRINAGVLEQSLSGGATDVEEGGNL